MILLGLSVVLKEVYIKVMTFPMQNSKRNLRTRPNSAQGHLVALRDNVMHFLIDE